MTFSNNMRQVGIALLNYESTYRSLPPAYTVDANGNKLHSWRTLILPFMEEATLFNSIDFSKPWDAPENAMARGAQVMVYHSNTAKLEPGHTLIQAIVDPSSVFPGPKGVKLRDMTDGTSNTILIAEAGVDHSVHWMEPNDMDLNYFLNMMSESRAFRFGFHIVKVDCSSQFLDDRSATPDILKAMVTKDGGEQPTYLP